jgi:hypothetical protein
MGCEIEDNRVCKACLEIGYNGKQAFCTDSTCNCDNKSKTFITRRKNKRAATEPDWSKLEKRCGSLEEWKKKHVTINYPSRHKGRYLVDLLRSRDSFEVGYGKWLLDHPPTDEYGPAQREQYTKIYEEMQALHKMCLPKGRRSARLKSKKD